jgi:hypothetical protein
MVEISHQLVQVYGEEVMGHQIVAKWCSHFDSGRDGAKGYERSGSPAAGSSTENRARVEAAILKNKRVTVSELEHDLGLSH